MTLSLTDQISTTVACRRSSDDVFDCICSSMDAAQCPAMTQSPIVMTEKGSQSVRHDDLEQRKTNKNRVNM